MEMLYHEENQDSGKTMRAGSTSRRIRTKQGFCMTRGTLKFKTQTASLH